MTDPTTDPAIIAAESYLGERAPNGMVMQLADDIRASLTATGEAPVPVTKSNPKWNTLED